MRRAVILALLLGAFLPGSSAAQESKQDLLRGSDGEFDASNFLAKRGAFLPAPIVITEPAIGYGGGLAAIFFHGGNPMKNRAEGQRTAPPSVTAVAAFATENGSRGAGAAHFGVWNDDHIRYLGVLGTAKLNLEYWGLGSNPRPAPLNYSVSGALTIQRLQFRIGDSPVMVGGEWSFSRQKAETKSGLFPPGIAPPSKEQDDSGIGAIVEYETLDNLFTAEHGMKGRVLAKTFSTRLGGDNNRRRLDIDTFGYVPLPHRLTLGLRGAASLSDGETPFYLLPYLDMRGLPALKYSGKHVALGELETRWRFYGRWSAVAFGGLGWVSESNAALGQSGTVAAYGGGFRYLLAEKLGIHTGIDYGKGPDDYAIYLILGSAWR